MFNALRYIKKLEAVGFPREQAEVQVQLVLDSIEQEVATKGDIAEVRSDFSKLRGEFGELRGQFGELRSEFGDLRGEFGELLGKFGELRGEFGELRGEFAELRGEFVELKAEIMVKMGATIVGSVTVSTAILGFLITLK